MSACPAGSARQKRTRGCLDDAALLSAVQKYARSADEAVVRVFDFGPYDDMRMSSSADVSGLAALASLLGPLLEAAPQGVISQSCLAAVFGQVLAARGVPQRNCAAQAEQAAGRARVALAHLRRLFQQPAVRAQRCKAVSAQHISALQCLAELYDRSSDASGAPSASSRGSAPLRPDSPAALCDEDGEAEAKEEGEEDEEPLPEQALTALALGEGASPAVQREGWGALPNSTLAEPKPRVQTPTPHSERGAPSRLSSSPPAHCAGAAHLAKTAESGSGERAAFAQRDATNAVLDAVCAHHGQPRGAPATLEGPRASKAAAASAQATPVLSPLASFASGIMTSRSTSACACRIIGGRHIFQVAVPGNVVQARRIAEGGRDRILSGESLDDVKKWLRAEKRAAVAAAAR